MLHYAPSNNLCFCNYLAKRETRKLHFSLAVLVHRENSTMQSLLDFFINLVINAFSLGLLGSTVLEKESQECCSSWTVLHAQSTSALSSGFPFSQGNAEALDT